MTRPVVQLHTIDQWMQVDLRLRPLILMELKVKDRLQKFLSKLSNGPAPTEAEWVPCSKCNKKGWVLDEPRYPGIHPSQLPHPCMLKVWNEMTGVEGHEKIEPRTRLIFDIGHAVHHMMQTYGAHGAWGDVFYKPESKLTGEIQPLSEELMIEGSADAENIIIVDNIPNAPIYEVGVVHEYKTINTDGYGKLSRPKPEHKQQATIYAKVLNRPIVVYLYLNKNDSSLKDFPVEFDPAQWNTLEHKARLLVQYFDAGQPPPAETGYHCQQCPYSYGCAAYKAMALGRVAARR
jgi:CRISPR/Cas system-associated exonuclease Cas4 (RecB family)